MRYNNVEQIKIVPVVNTPLRVLALLVLFIFVVVIWINPDKD